MQKLSKKTKYVVGFLCAWLGGTIIIGGIDYCGNIPPITIARATGIGLVASGLFWLAIGLLFAAQKFLLD